MLKQRCTREVCYCPVPGDEAARAYLVSGELWARVKPLLPAERPNTHRFGGGRPRACERRCLGGILFVLKTGCQWKALSATGICASSTAHDRFGEWVAAGVFLGLWRAGLGAYDELVGLDWRWLAMDGCMTKAPLGGGKDRPQPRGPGQGGVQAVAADGGVGRAGRRRGGRGEHAGHEDGAGDGRGDRRRPARAPAA